MLRQVEQVWRSFFNALKAWRQEPTKFRNRPRPPGYKPKNGMHMVSFPRPRVRIRGTRILFARNLMARGFPSFSLGKLPLTAKTCVGARLMPFYDRFVVELLYEVLFQPFPLTEIGPRAIGIDLGVTNLVATSDGLLVKGGVVKTINQWYNKQLAKYQSLAIIHTQLQTTHRIQRLHRIRTNKITDFFHKTSRLLINHCLQNNISTVVIGYNEQWKQQCNLGAQTNQTFVQIPFLRLVQILEYKAALVGITVRRVSEAYTSQQRSHCGNVDKRNRRSRGLYLCRCCGTRLNADHNAARNILMRFSSACQVVPPTGKSDLFSCLRDSGCVAHPVKILIN